MPGGARDLRFLLALTAAASPLVGYLIDANWHPRNGSPKLPTGYTGMLPLALVPPLWFAAMNHRVPRPAHA